MVDCNEGAHAKQQPTKLYGASQEQATIVEQHRQCNDHVLHCVARGYNSGDNGWSQQAHEIAQAMNNPFHWCGSTTSTIMKAWIASNKIDRDAMTQCQQHDNHSFLSYCKEWQQYQTNAREERNNSHATIKCSCCCLQDARWQYHTTQQPAAQVCWGQVQQVPKDGVCIAKGVYIAKGKYIEYAKDIVYVAKCEYGNYAKEDASIKEGHNKPLTKKDNNKPLAKDGNWLGTTKSPSPQG